MTGSETAQIITSVATLTAAVGSFLVSLRNNQKIEEVKTATNGMQKKLESAAFTAGQQDQKDHPR